MKKKFPKQIFVTWADYGTWGDDDYLDATETPEGLDDGQKVGVYKLVAVKTQKITEELV